MNERHRLFIKVERNTLPQITDKYPFIYLERGRLEIDDSSVKWIDYEGNLVRIPVAMIHTILLGPGTSITHEAVKVMTSANCTVCWVGEDSLLFYAVGDTPTADTRNMRQQMQLAANQKNRLLVAKKMFLQRFPNEDIEDKTLHELMGMEGKRVKQTYEEMAQKYDVGWKGRSYIPGKFELGDMTNKIITASNAALYALITSAVHSLGYSPHIGFVHSGSPLPFVYDLADLYKEHLCIDLAFKLTFEMGGIYNRHRVAEEFRTRVIECELLKKIPKDIEFLMKEN
nr:type I-E CRISPR-associated endonuclease Cas1e [uncultured Sphaerochaeta sp.]